jgi:hypothetical protein
VEFVFWAVVGGVVYITWLVGTVVLMELWDRIVGLFTR